MTRGPAVVIAGTVRNSVVVPDEEGLLPDGARVGIGLAVADLDPGLADELAAWDRAGDEAWAMIPGWEAPESAR